MLCDLAPSATRPGSEPRSLPGLDVAGPLYATTTEAGARFHEIARTESASRGQVAFGAV